MTRVALLNPNWNFEGSIYFGCRSPHLPLELGISQHYLRQAGHSTLLLDAHMFDLSLADIAAELRSFRPDMVVVTTAPTYLFWRCAPPELRVPQQLTFALRDLAPILIAVGDHDDIARGAPELIELIPTARLVTITGRDHMSAVVAREFKQAALEFLTTE